MGLLKKFYQVLSILSVIFGLFLLASMKMKNFGAVIGLSNLSVKLNLGFGLFFAICGIVLFLIQIADKKLK